MTKASPLSPDPSHRAGKPGFVVVLGAGTIGGTIAELLVRDRYDVIVVDLSKAQLDRLEGRLDIQTVQGHACDPRILHRVGVEGADVVLALTDDEEANLLAASTAKRMGCRKSVARVRSPHYLRQQDFNFRSMLDIDLILSPEVMTAAQVVKYLDHPDAMALEFYAQGKVGLLQFELDPSHRFCGKTLRELRLPEGVLVVLVSRGKELFIPHGDVQLLAGDKVTLLGKSGTLSDTYSLTAKSKSKLNTIMIAGGGETGALLASALEHKVRTLKLIEVSLDRCRQLGEFLDKTNVLHGDATDRALLNDERLSQADIFIAAMQSDEANIMAALLAKTQGVQKAIAIVKRSDYTPLLLESTKLDLALSPREVTASRVLTLVKRGMIQNVALIEEGRAEVIEFRVSPKSELIDKALMDLKFPEGCIVGMIARGNNVKVPRGPDKIQAGDTVIMVTLAGIGTEVEALF